MGQIKNIHLLTDQDEQALAKMEHAATEHKRYSSIVFKIVDHSPQGVIIQIIQGKSAAGIYHNQKRLIEITHETFDRFFNGKKIKVHAIPYDIPKTSEVDAKWIADRMLATGTKLKDIAKDTGLDYTSLSALVNGTRPLSQTTQAMFYFYFQTKPDKK